MEVAKVVFNLRALLYYCNMVRGAHRGYHAAKACQLFLKLPGLGGVAYIYHNKNLEVIASPSSAVSGNI